MPHLCFSFFLSMTYFLSGTCCRTLALKTFKPGNTVCGGGVFTSRIFGWGYFLSRGFYHRHPSCRVRDYWRHRHILICEEQFAKVVYNLGALAPGTFGSGCAVPCEHYKWFKYVETIPHVEKLSICHIQGYHISFDEK